MHTGHETLRRHMTMVLLMFTLAATHEVGAQPSPDALNMAQQMTTSSKSAGEVALNMQRVHSQSPEQIAAILRKVGFGATEAASALVHDLSIPGRSAAAYMARTGYLTPDLIRAMVEFARIPAAEIMLGLRDIGSEAEEMAAGFHRLGYTVEETALALDNAGFSDEEVITGLMSSYPLVSYTTPGSATYLAKALRDIFSFHSLYSRLIEFGYPLDQLVLAARDAFGVEWLSSAICLLSEKFGRQETVDALREAGYESITLGRALCLLPCELNLSQEQATAILGNAGYDPDEIADSVLSCRR